MVRCRAVAIPGGDATSQDQLSMVQLYNFEDLGTHAKSFQSPEGEKVLSSARNKENGGLNSVHGRLYPWPSIAPRAWSALHF